MKLKNTVQKLEVNVKSIELELENVKCKCVVVQYEVEKCVMKSVRMNYKKFRKEQLKKSKLTVESVKLSIVKLNMLP